MKNVVRSRKKNKRLNTISGIATRSRYPILDDLQRKGDMKTIYSFTGRDGAPEVPGIQYNPTLVDLETDPTETAELLSYAGSIPSAQLSQRELCDLEMLATGAFSPLRTFMSAADYKSVLETMRLADGTLYPIPITLSVSDASRIKLDSDIALRGPKNDLLAI